MREPNRQPSSRARVRRRLRHLGGPVLSGQRNLRLQSEVLEAARAWSLRAKKSTSKPWVRKPAMATTNRAMHTSRRRPTESCCAGSNLSLLLDAGAPHTSVRAFKHPLITRGPPVRVGAPSPQAAGDRMGGERRVEGWRSRATQQQLGPLGPACLPREGLRGPQSEESWATARGRLPRA